jgi:AcrR family transcriptional regulator
VTSADGNPFEDEVAGLLVEASFDLLAKGGWGHFSLRAVAESIGAAGSAASHRFGDRAGLVAALCDAAVRRERQEMARFAPQVRVDTNEELSAILYEWLEQRVRWNRKQARACAELLLVSYRDPACRGFGPAWSEACRDFVNRLHPALDAEAARTITAFLSVEIVYWLLLADDPMFRLASREALGRVIHVAARPQNDLAGAPPPAFWFGQGLEQPDTRRSRPLTGTKQRIIEATAQIILECGVQAVTHREIAKRSDASLSSLTYHFESLTDLIRQGLQTIFTPVPPGSGTPPPMPYRAVVPYELAVQALRDPFLSPLAATCRRRAGMGLFGECPASDDPRAIALCEIGVILETAQVLTGQSGAHARDGLCMAC